MGKFEYLPIGNPEGTRKVSGLMSRTVFVSLIYWCFAIRIQRTASRQQDALALLKEKGWKSLCQTPVSLIQFNTYMSIYYFHVAVL